MVNLPANFVKLANYQGYYVNLVERQVYSIKSGILRPMSRQKPSYFNHQLDGWIISNGGKNKKVRITIEFVNRICDAPMHVTQTVEVGERRVRTIKRK